MIQLRSVVKISLCACTSKLQLFLCAHSFTLKENSNLKRHKYKVVGSIQYYSDQLLQFLYVHAHANYNCSYVHRILHYEGGSNLKRHKYNVVGCIQYYSDQLLEFLYVHAHANYSCSYVQRILHYEGEIKSKRHKYNVVGSIQYYSDQLL